MDAAEALLQPVRVPGQVVVDHQVGALQVDAFAGGVGGQQDLHLRVVPERFLRRQAFLAADAAVYEDHRCLSAEQGRDALLQVAQRVPVLGGRRPRRAPGCLREGAKSYAKVKHVLPPPVKPCVGGLQPLSPLHAADAVHAGTLRRRPWPSPLLEAVHADPSLILRKLAAYPPSERAGGRPRCGKSAASNALCSCSTGPRTPVAGCQLNVKTLNVGFRPLPQTTREWLRSALGADHGFTGVLVSNPTHTDY